MGKKFLFLILLIGSCSCLNAQENTSNTSELMEIIIPAGQDVKKAKLSGVWQLCEMKEDAGSYHLRMAPMLKILSSDRSFMNLLTANNRTVVMAEGIYKEKSKSVYEEKVQKSLYINIAAELKNQITYEFLHDNLMKISFPINMGTDRMGVEYWYRVGFQYPDGGNGIR